MLKLQNISKRYAKTQALHSIDLCIPQGETTVLIGPSGCGKSTLLRLIVGLVPLDSGEIIFDNTLLGVSNIQKSRQRMGYVIQEGGLFPHLTAAENVCLMAKYLAWDDKTIQQRLDELSELVKLPAALLTQYPIELSGGQCQRVSLMRALMLDPDLLLLDEPLGSLDPMIRYELQQDLKEIFQRLHKTVLLVTHDMGEAGFFGNTIVMLRDGQIVQQGSLQDLLHQPKEPFVEAFIKAQRDPFLALDK